MQNPTKTTQSRPTRKTRGTRKAPKTLTTLRAWEWVRDRLARPDWAGLPVGICSCIATLAGSRLISPAQATTMTAQLLTIRPAQDEGPHPYYWGIGPAGRQKRIAAIDTLLHTLRTRTP